MSGAEQPAALTRDVHMIEREEHTHERRGATYRIVALDAHISEREEHVQTHERRGATDRARSRDAHTSKREEYMQRMSGASNTTALALDALAHEQKRRHMSKREEHMQTHERRGATRPHTLSIAKEKSADASAARSTDCTRPQRAHTKEKVHANA